MTEYRELKEKIVGFPESPGVYLIKDKNGCAIYVGKAVSLKDRLRSYFVKADDLNKDAKIDLILKEAQEIDYIPAPSEIEAYLMEARLIKDLHPKYNVLMKDDKTYPLLVIYDKEEFPRVKITRDRRLKGCEYFGPFVHSNELNSAFRTFQAIFKFRVCNLNIKSDEPNNLYFKPCLLYHINLCSAPCANKITKEDYRRDIESLMQFIRGERDNLLEGLRKKMEEFSRKLEFERAVIIRDQIIALESLPRKSKLIHPFKYENLTPIDSKKSVKSLQKLLNLEKTPRVIEGYDISNISGKEATGSVVVFIDGVPFKDGYRKFKIKTVENIDDYSMMREVVSRRITRLIEEDGVMPDIMLIDGGKQHLNCVEGELNKFTLKQRPLVVAISKGEQNCLYIGNRDEPVISKHSAGFKLMQFIRDEAHRFAQHYHHFLRKKKLMRDE